MKNFSSEHKGNIAVVYSQVDKLDSSNAPELKSMFLHLNKSSKNLIILDMSQTKYCDSSGLSAILIANRLCKDNSGTFCLAGLQPNVFKLIQIAQLDQVLNLCENVDSALVKLK
ncbi:MAG: STAS domain-containing protein [Crocinitomicaceae bacterium]|jgi:anti-anti-sigma factor|tara:strand:- start:4125 stop:4466 length:342 start_codon:yes stop_codon:yes gene_type:complete